MGRQPRLFAGLNVLDLEVAAIGDDIDILDIENGAGRLAVDRSIESVGARGHGGSSGPLDGAAVEAGAVKHWQR